MDFSSLKFAASMAADAAKDRLNSTLSTTHARAQELAAGSMESLQTRMASASDAVSRTANDVRSFDVSRLDPTKMDVSSSLNTLHESVIQTAAHASSIVESAASTTLSTTINIGSGSWPATEPNGSSSQGEGEGSDGEGVRIGRGLFSSWGAAAEKQTLLGGESGESSDSNPPPLPSPPPPPPTPHPHLRRERERSRHSSAARRERIVCHLILTPPPLFPPP